MQKSLLLLLASAVLAIPAGNTIAQNKKDVAILKCIESNEQGGGIRETGKPAVFQFQATFQSPDECLDAKEGQRCDACLQRLIRDFACEGGPEFTSNGVVDQLSDSRAQGPQVPPTRSINKYTFACNAPGR
jgi:hypothetical protein